jgi:hypothetical protein
MPTIGRLHHHKPGTEAGRWACSEQRSLCLSVPTTNALFAGEVQSKAPAFRAVASVCRSSNPVRSSGESPENRRERHQIARGHPHRGWQDSSPRSQARTLACTILRQAPCRLITPRRAACARASVRPTASSLSSSEPTLRRPSGRAGLVARACATSSPRLSSRSPTNLGAPDDVAVSQDKAVGCNNHPGTPDCVTAAMGQIAALIPLAREVLWALFLSLRAIALRRILDDQERSET